MSSKFTVSGSNTTVEFAFTAPTAAVQNIVTNCAEYLIDRGYGDGKTLVELTNAQKLAILESYIKSAIVELANTNKSIKAQAAARNAEEAAKYSLT